MITSRIRSPAGTIARIASVDLLPAHADWREGDLAHPALAYRVKAHLPVGEEVVLATLWIGADYTEDESGVETVTGLGVESGTAPMPKADQHAATPKTVIQAGADGAPRSFVAVGEDGLPMVDPKEPAGTSHWAIARFVPTKAGAALKLDGVIEVIPKVVQSGSDKGQYAHDASGCQCVSVASGFDWEPTQILAKRAGGAPLNIRGGNRGCAVPVRKFA